MRRLASRFATLAEALWSEVTHLDSGCWKRSGATSRGTGASVFTWRYRQYYANRVAWELTKGEIPQGYHPKPTCGSAWCCNPDHLQLTRRQGRRKR